MRSCAFPLPNIMSKIAGFTATKLSTDTKNKQPTDTKAKLPTTTTTNNRAHDTEPSTDTEPLNPSAKPSESSTHVGKQINVGQQDVTKWTTDLILHRGRVTDEFMDMKASNADSVAVLGAFVLAFVLGNVHDDAEEVDLSDQLSVAAWLTLLLSASSGVSCVLMLVFTSAKLRRLIAQSVVTFARDASAQELATMYGGPDRLRAKLGDFIDETNTVKFPALAWYQGHGKNHVQAGLFLLVLQIVLYMLFMALRTGTVQSGGLALLSAVLLLVPCGLTLAYLLHSKAMLNLK